MCLCACMPACVPACVHAYVHACVRVLAFIHASRLALENCGQKELKFSMATTVEHMDIFAEFHLATPLASCLLVYLLIDRCLFPDTLAYRAQVFRG